ncbi:MAG: type II toxin-antitoxin system RelE/ParE family toxin [Cyclobacteriaceae bacterium]
MEKESRKEIILTKRFRKHADRVYDYLLTNFSSKTALEFLDKINERIELISKHPTIGKTSGDHRNVRSIIINPYNLLFYRYQNDKIKILCLFDMRRNPERKPY